jgi:phage shock protein C
MTRTNLSDEKIAGVCGGIAKEFEIDPIWIRGGLILLTLAGGFPGFLVYLIGWVLMDEER